MSESKMFMLYGEEWQIFVMKMSKKAIVDLLKEVCIERKELEIELDELTKRLETNKF